MASDEDRPLAGVADQLARLTTLLLDTTTVAGVLTRVVTTCQELVPGTDLVSVTLRSPDGRFHTPFETASEAAKLDQVQYDAGSGPCVESSLEPGPAYTYAADLESEPKWPEFAAAATGFGYRSVLSTALLPDVTLSGALNVYSREPQGFGADSRDRALLLATHASLALASTTAYEKFELERAQLREAIQSRDVIGQAKGILMQRRGLDADEAFRLLAKTSQDMNMKVGVVAETLASRHAELA